MLAMKSYHSVLLWALLALFLAGCNLLHQSDSLQRLSDVELVSSLKRPSKLSEPTPEDHEKVANPPARSIRFDGREIVLGSAEMTPVATGEFCSELASLLEQEKYFSASQLVSQSVGTSEQALWERYVDATSDPLVAFIAKSLSVDVTQSISWNSLLVAVEAKSVDAKLYHQVRSQFIERLKAEEPSDEQTEQLKNVGQRVNHPLVMVDALRLIALRELVAGRHAWAESLFLQAAEICDQHQDLARSAECWLMAATTCNRAERAAPAKHAWLAAAERQLELHRGHQSALNLQFWTRLEKQ